MAEGKYELGKTHRYRQSGPHRQLEDHRRPFDTLRTGIEDPPVIVKILAHLGLPTRAPPRSLRSDSIYSRQSEEPKIGCQREPTAPLALSSSERRDPAHFARLRPLRRPSRRKQHRDFHQTERRLTSYRSGDIAQARKKVV